ncbi:MAG: hydrogenase maturation nickel metallochaperone HypA [Methanocalculus sp. MSAO_Arc1]|uniref:hydrogenase maturation nickel metallochaperone HypA/HybF n=1 Tax=Methanocalculus TaxID=71151 RepID=UPI000FF62C4E|nr:MULTISPECIES: hydrogenase maturation nickel metallochaperone HypA [unclassified Methanocalculus]MCP1662843.1 hydrogenase nickel incorporation protein HypA/HybF [Methanocalculus sp. AMF5]RQD78995.1 MAG: hydrogenase maturation nickel metallochaperone HypA [Methanocalculus sp. MSAO_Arc1]
MHEYSIAYDIYATARRTALDHNATAVHTINVTFGELAMVNPEQVSFLFSAIAEDDEIMSGATLVCETEPPSTTCSCGYAGTEIYVCPDCGKLPSLVSGKEIVVKNIEIDSGE